MLSMVKLYSNTSKVKKQIRCDSLKLTKGFVIFMEYLLFL